MSCQRTYGTGTQQVPSILLLRTMRVSIRPVPVIEFAHKQTVKPQGAAIRCWPAYGVTFLLWQDRLTDGLRTNLPIVLLAMAVWTETDCVLNDVLPA